MFALVLYKDKYSVKSIRSKYAGRLIARNRDKKCLLDVAKNLNCNIPLVNLKNVTLANNSVSNNVVEESMYNDKIIQDDNKASGGVFNNSLDITNFDNDCNDISHSTCICGRHSTDTSQVANENYVCNEHSNNNVTFRNTSSLNRSHSIDNVILTQTCHLINSVTSESYNVSKNKDIIENNRNEEVPNDVSNIMAVGANNNVICDITYIVNESIVDEVNYDNIIDDNIINNENNIRTSEHIAETADSNSVNIHTDIESDKNNDDTTYIPSTSNVSSNSNVNNNSDMKNNRQSKSDDSKNATIDSINTSQVNVYGCNDEKMYVSTSKPKGAQKKNFCFFCKKFQSKIARHLEKIHCNEEEVQKFSVLPKGTLERKKIIETLRRNGNFLFNTDPLLNNGELIVCRRPQSKLSRTATDFTCCIKCKGFFTKNNIRHHFAQCNGKKLFRAVQVLGRKISGRIHNDASDVLKNVIFPVLRDDLVTRSIRYDQLLITYGNKLAVKYKHVHQHDMIRSRLRLLGRFLLAIRKFNNNLEQFSSIYDPLHYDDCIRAVQEVAQLDKNTNSYKAPATAANLGTLIKQVGNIFITQCIKFHEYKRKENAENFLKILQEDYAISINKVVEETQAQNRRQKKVVLPSIDDIQKLYNYLHQIRRTAHEQLKQGFMYKAWLDLAESTLILLQLFNRRRAGEIERVLIEDFKSYKSIDENTHKELYLSLSSVSQKLVKRYVIFSIRGKLMRTVPVILHAQLLECLQLILKYRLDAAVPSKNPFLFGITSDNKKRFKYLRACVLLRKFSTKCDAKLPNSLRGTKLRKHIATCCITLNLSDNQVDDLANFMGHDKNIHKSYYRQPIPELEILRITQLLEVAQGGIEHEEENEEENEDENEGGNENENAEDENKENEDVNENDNKDYSNDNTYENINIECDDNEFDIEGEEQDGNSFQNYISPKKRCMKGQNKNIRANVLEKDISINTGKKRRSTSPYGKTKRIRWTKNECAIIYKEFHSTFLNSKLPSSADILRVKLNNAALRDRSIAQIRTWIHNHISGKTKKHVL